MNQIEILSAEDVLANEIRAYIERAVAAGGGDTTAQKPGHRVKFHWPPHPESYSYHILPSDWTGRSKVVINGETFEIETAKTGSWVFGRIPKLWFEAKGRDMKALESNLVRGVQPLLHRQRLIASTLERPGRFSEPISTLAPADQLKLFYCSDRDVANEGRKAVETRASRGGFLPALLVILRDQSHPYRRSAQWATLDLFEDLNSFCRNDGGSSLVVEAIHDLIWNATDDYARTIYKAGVVLGGHVPYGLGGDAILDCLNAPSKIGRRSAIHGCFHLAEWAPEKKDTIITRLSDVAKNDQEPILREYAGAMLHDIERADTLHVDDVTFPDEP